LFTGLILRWIFPSLKPYEDFEHWESLTNEQNQNISEFEEKISENFFSKYLNKIKNKIINNENEKINNGFINEKNDNI
jgi:hypothetical protein